MVDYSKEIIASVISLSDALKAKESNNVIKELIKYKSDQRKLIQEAYAQIFKTSLSDDMKRTFSGNVLNTSLNLLKRTEEFEAECLRDGFKGVGTKNSILVEILCSKDGNQMKLLVQEYEKLTGQKLVEKLKSDRHSSRYFTRLLVALASGTRDTTDVVNTDLAKIQATQLYKAGIGKMGTDEEVFIEILSQANFKQIQEVSKIYGQSNKLNLKAAIIKEMSGYLEVALCSILDCIENRPLYFAKCFKEALEGKAHTVDDIARILVSRSGIDLNEIKEAYEAKYGLSMFAEIRGLYLKNEVSEENGLLFLSFV